MESTERQREYVLRTVEERGVRMIRLWFTDVLGQLKSFAISPVELQGAFDEGMRYQHSFWYRESKTSFEEALRADAQCAIAYWGIAQSLLANPFNPTPPKNLVEGLAGKPAI